MAKREKTPMPHVSRPGRVEMDASTMTFDELDKIIASGREMTEQEWIDAANLRIGIKNELFRREIKTWPLWRLRLAEILLSIKAAFLYCARLANIDIYDYRSDVEPASPSECRQPLKTTQADAPSKASYKGRLDRNRCG